MHSSHEDQEEIKKVTEQLKNLKKEANSIASKEDEVVTPEIVHGWQKSIEEITSSLTEIGKEAIQYFNEKSERENNTEVMKMNFDYKAFLHRFWGSLIIGIVCIASIVMLELLNKGQNIISTLTLIIGLTITYITTGGSIFNRPQKEDKNKKIEI